MAEPQRKSAVADPWEEEAKNFKASPQSGPASTPSGSDDDWKIWQGGTGGQETGGGNAIQRAFDTLTTVTPEQQAGHGRVVNGIQKFGAGAIQGVGQPFVHPIDTAAGVVHAVAHPWDELHEEVNSLRDNPAQFAGNVAGGAILGGATEGVVRPLARAGLQKFHPTSSPQIVPPIQTAAEKMAGSIVPKAKQIPGFVNDIQRNAGNIRDFVRESGNPMRTQAEFEKALEGAGNKRYEHFNQNILNPNLAQPIDVPESYGGQLSAPGKATIGDVNARIARINKVMSPAYANANPGDVQTALTQKPMEAYQAEHAQITPVFHEALSQLTGIPAEDIANLRQDFGSLQGLGNTIKEARAGRIKKVGEGAEGSTSPTLHASPFSFINQGIDMLRGGRTAIADRAFQKSWKGFEPLAGEGRPLPQTPEGFQAQKAFQESANQEAAQAEAARMHQAEMAAQDAAAQRAQRAQGLRESRRATAAEQTKLEGESARTIGRRNVLNQRSK